MDILKLCQLGEGKTLEFKRNAESLVPILKSVIAFANTAGGIILLGIEDEGSIVGVDNPSKVQEQLANSIINRVKPQLYPDFTVVEVNLKTVICIQIEHGHGPYFLSDKGLEKSVYIRVGNTNHLASPEVVTELKRDKNYATFDKMPCDNVTESDLDSSLIKSIYGTRGRPIDTEKLISVGVLTKKGRRVIATNAGVILFGLPTVREENFPYAEVRCARFKGVDRAEFIDRLNIEGGILSAIEEVPKFIRRNTKMAGKFGAMRRRDISEYPAEGIREALTNALVHANYEVSGSRIFVAIYDDRLEIQNPGIMLPGMSIEQFKAGVSRIRNPIIARTFGELELVEEWGSGYKRIATACKKGGYPTPEWEEFGTALRVTFHPHPEISEQYQVDAHAGTQLAPSWHPVGTQSELTQDSMIIVESFDRETLLLINFCTNERSFQEILNYMKWKDRTKFRRRFISPLLERNIIRQTIPEKPNTPKQKYIITEKIRERLTHGKIAPTNLQTDR